MLGREPPGMLEKEDPAGKRASWHAREEEIMLGRGPSWHAREEEGGWSSHHTTQAGRVY